MIDDLVMVGLIEGAYEQSCRVYDPIGLCPTLTTRLSGNGSGGLILERNYQNKDEQLKRLYGTCERGGN